MDAGSDIDTVGLVASPTSGLIATRTVKAGLPVLAVERPRHVMALNLAGVALMLAGVVSGTWVLDALGMLAIVAGNWIARGTSLRLGGRALTAYGKHTWLEDVLRCDVSAPIAPRSTFS